jgi:hypothetical protein
MVWGGSRMEIMLRKYIDRIGWTVIVIAVIGYLVV